MWTRNGTKSRDTNDSGRSQDVPAGRWAALRSDLSVWSLIASNLAVMVWAVIEGWSLYQLMWVYWAQSVIIGLFWGIKIFRLEKFSTKGFRINKRAVAPTTETKIKTGIFFLLHYNGFHLLYALFLLSEMEARPSRVVLLAVMIFFVNQVFSEWHNRGRIIKAKPNIGKLMFYPYMRIIPMHFTMIGATTLREKFALESEGRIALVLFLLLKTVADVGMYVVHKKGFADKPGRGHKDGGPLTRLISGRTRQQKAAGTRSS